MYTAMQSAAIGSAIGQCGEFHEHQRDQRYGTGDSIGEKMLAVGFKRDRAMPFAAGNKISPDNRIHEHGQDDEGQSPVDLHGAGMRKSLRSPAWHPRRLPA